MKRTLLIFALLSPFALIAQTKTTDALEKKVDGIFTMFFYKNTLRMLNQQDNKEFDEMVKNIEKMKFLMVDKSTKNFGPAEYKKLRDGYVSESYEPIVTSRHEGRNFDVYLKDKAGYALGTVVLVNDSTKLYILDIIGTIDIRNASKLFSSLDGSSEIAQKIKSFADKDGKHE